MYNWEMHTKSGKVEGANTTLQAAIDMMIEYANGQTIRDFYVNGHHMNEEFDLWISEGKVVFDEGQEFVPGNEWYARLGNGQAAMTEADVMGELTNLLVTAFGHGR
jgi:hypothetical protein